MTRRMIGIGRRTGVGSRTLGGSWDGVCDAVCTVG